MVSNLRLIRPIKLAALPNTLRQQFRRSKALFLVSSYFPQLLPQTQRLPDWTGILNFFLRRVEQDGWFRIDWQLVETLNNIAAHNLDYEDTPDQESPAWEQLSRALDYIPVRLWGFSEAWPFHVSPMNRSQKLLQLLLDPRSPRVEDLPPSVAASLGLPARFRWSATDRSRAWQQIERINSESAPVPLCWLPEVARYVCASTGNYLLDSAMNWDGWEEIKFSWHDPLQVLLIRQLWLEAQETLDRVGALARWANEQPSDLLLTLLTGHLVEDGLIAQPQRLPAT